MWGCDGFGVEDVLVAETGLLQHQRFQDKRDEIRGALALDQAFSALVERDVAVRRRTAIGVLDGCGAVVAVAEDSVRVFCCAAESL